MLAAHAGSAAAQSIESAIMPGPLVQGHAKYEADCKNCHVRFDRAAQRRLCLDCHKEVASDVRGKQGYHGRLKEEECRGCHTEHKGRSAKIVPLEEKTFNHVQTDFALQGKHKEVDCAKCHRPGLKHREAGSTCVACHRKDDKHESTLGPKCETCHDEVDWKKSKFAHDKSKFPLLHRHVQVKCAECHKDPAHYAKTPRECFACHRKDDKHEGTLGQKCEACHDEGDWKKSKFVHEKTKFALLYRHAKVKCVECHRNPAHFAKTPRECLACHRKDDVHKSALGEKCETCHNEQGWKEPARFDHDRDTPFALRDKHRDAKCDGCHKDAKLKDGRYREKPPSACVKCHERDDRERGHKGRYGEKCQTCHAEKTWKTPIFVHERDTKYTLRGKHGQVKCDNCHKGTLYVEKLEMQCFSCHTKDDKHKGQVGNDCARCHSERDWKEAPFDHGKSKFPLTGRHTGVECKKCHTTLAFKDASPECFSCHAKDDYHKEKLGPRCEQCHDARGWKDWKFDHDKRTKFKLADKHAKIKCLYCHTTPVKNKFTLASDCASCHRKTDDVHLGTLGTQCEKCHYTDNWRHVVKPVPDPAPR